MAASYTNDMTSHDRLPAVVCVVDDDVAVCAALAILVESAGYRTRCFTSGEAFVEASRTSPADCAVVDVAMPGLDGPGVLSALRHNGNLVPVIFITAHDHPARHRQLVADGGRVVLLKPVDPATLLREIQCSLDDSGRTEPHLRA